jgi:hypothetical protein
MLAEVTATFTTGVALLTVRVSPEAPQLEATALLLASPPYDAMK